MPPLKAQPAPADATAAPAVDPADPVAAGADAPVPSRAEALLAQLKEDAKGRELVGTFVSTAGGVNNQKQVEAGLTALIDELVQMGSTAAVVDRPLQTVAAIRQAIDERIAAQVNEILHDPAFQKLEGSWRGLDHLVSTVGLRPDMQVKVMNVRKDELGVLFNRYKGAEWQFNPLYHRVYTDAYSQWGAAPFACLVGDYEFDHSPADVKVLHGMIDIAAVAHCPFIAAADPKLMNVRSWDQLGGVRDLAVETSGADYAEWNSLRADPDACYLALTMPRFVARRPYGSKTAPVEKPMAWFEEQTDGARPDKIVWANAAFAMAANIARSFRRFGQTAAISGITSGGGVERLNLHRYQTAEGENAIRVPTEVLIDDVRAAELANVGLSAIVYKAGSDEAAFIETPSVQRPAKYEGDGGAEATANAAMTANLPYLLSVCRIAHYMKQIGQLLQGQRLTRDVLERNLNTWLNGYVLDKPERHPQEEWIKRPFAAAKVTVADIEGNPGEYTSTFYIRPHYLLKSLTTNLSLVTRVPKG